MYLPKVIGNRIDTEKVKSSSRPTGILALDFNGLIGSSEVLKLSRLTITLFIVEAYSALVNGIRFALNSLGVD